MKTTIRKEKEIKIKEIYVAQRFKDEEDKANLDNLIENLKFHGMINAINVWEDHNGNYHLISGYHRLTACKILGKETIRVTIDTTKYKNEVDAYRNHRQENLHENGIRKHHTIYQLSKIFDELQVLYEQINPDNKFAEEEYLRARKREKMAKESLKGRKAKEEQEYFKREIEKAKQIQEKTKSPLQRLIDDRGFSEVKAKQIQFINGLDKIMPNFSKKMEASNISENRIWNLRKMFKKEDVIDQFKKINTTRDMNNWVSKLEGKKEGSKINVSEIADEGNGIVRLGTKHYVCYSDTEHLVRKFNFNIRMVVDDNDVAKAAIEVLGINHVKALIVCTNDTAHELVLNAIKK
ncbi:TPA: ParB N-terminal domain-containing protein [Clostridioides difficile]|uniref:ParB-like N-terminal domain-containing protein n=5 Tax=Clostridioides difficile TaxID=1496 RepID=A0A069AG44_CLODI|nr:ParB N-terminal domain-containing protein [Clostridioides difficile]AXU80663.1 ParB/RepB/Spo0J family partition protein [Clostridioides difficile]EGT3760396.1 hypothetical protein [Clostridioides difficile]EGT3766812.1 hypothetical protein [Clostridioides difficile]EGT4111727.1 hypothetical protein [Clostridioides difficile]EGT4517090.1 hypothetical protein [Clostridioides difficile]